MDKKIDDYELSITKSVSIDRPLESGKEYTVVLKVGIVEAGGLYDNQDGTFTFKIKGQAIGGQVVNEQGRVLHIKRKGSKSQVLRRIIEDLWFESGKVEDKEVFYNLEMDKIIDNYEQKKKV